MLLLLVLCVAVGIVQQGLRSVAVHAIHPESSQ